MIKISVCGHFGFNKNLVNGQTIKTKIVTDELKSFFGSDAISYIDTCGGLKSIISITFQLINKLFTSSAIVVFPSYKGLQFIIPVLTFMNKFIKKPIHYVVIGGWLPSFLSNKKFLTKMLKNLDGIYVETKCMKQELEKNGFKNVLVMPNCKPLRIVEKEVLTKKRNHKIKLCTFSRVMKEKGIEDAIEATILANNELNQNVFELDIYGQVEKNQEVWFKSLISEVPNYISYKGIVDYSNTINTLKQYDMLLFPTFYKGEGFAGTLIDAMAAGLPVIATDWKYNSDIVLENQIGLLTPINDVKELKNNIIKLYNNEEEWFQYRENSITNSQKYLPKNAVSILINNILQTDSQ
ncbi:MAG: glycosyltransferase [Sphaerochaetaceae bacterium]|nr:glycosyltransferase [Sphaerochaetaceae bacterium]